MRILFILPNVDSPGYKPVGISTLSAIAKKRGHDVKLYDTSFFDTADYHSIKGFQTNTKVGESISNFIPVNEAKYGLNKIRIDLKADFIGMLKYYDPHLVLISTLSHEYALSIFLLELVKSHNKDILTIMGGRHCYSDPEAIIKEKSVDIVCIGEGEKPLNELLECFENKDDYSHVQGLWVKRNSDDVIKNSNISYFNDLDFLPYLDFDIYDHRQFFRIFCGKVYRSIDYVIKRGCTEQCGYCQSELIHEWHNGNRSIRSYSADRSIAELKYLKNRCGFDFIRFHDESFLSISKKELEYIAEQYIKHVNLPFIVDAAPQTVTEEKAELIKEMGCLSVSLGCESGNEKFRFNVLNKRVKNSTVINAFHYLKNNKIRTVMFNLIGFPFERREYIDDTIKLNRECGVDSPSIGFFYPFKGCKLRDVAIKNGFFNPDTEVNGAAQWVRNKPFLYNPDISFDEYIRIFRTFILYCKLPKKMYSEILRSENDDEVFQELSKYYAKTHLID